MAKIHVIPATPLPDTGEPAENREFPSREGSDDVLLSNLNASVTGANSDRASDGPPGSEGAEGPTAEAPLDDEGYMFGQAVRVDWKEGGKAKGYLSALFKWFAHLEARFHEVETTSAAPHLKWTLEFVNPRLEKEYASFHRVEAGIVYGKLLYAGLVVWALWILVGVATGPKLNTTVASCGLELLIIGLVAVRKAKPKHFSAHLKFYATLLALAVWALFLFLRAQPGAANYFAFGAPIIIFVEHGGMGLNFLHLLLIGMVQLVSSIIMSIMMDDHVLLMVSLIITIVGSLIGGQLAAYNIELKGRGYFMLTKRIQELEVFRRRRMRLDSQPLERKSSLNFLAVEKQARRDLIRDIISHNSDVPMAADMGVDVKPGCGRACCLKLTREFQHPELEQEFRDHWHHFSRFRILFIFGLLLTAEMLLIIQDFLFLSKQGFQTTLTLRLAAAMPLMLLLMTATKTMRGKPQATQPGKRYSHTQRDGPLGTHGMHRLVVIIVLLCGLVNVAIVLLLPKDASQDASDAYFGVCLRYMIQATVSMAMGFSESLLVSIVVTVAYIVGAFFTPWMLNYGYPGWLRGYFLLGIALIGCVFCLTLEDRKRAIFLLGRRLKQLESEMDNSVLSKLRKSSEASVLQHPSQIALT